MNSKNRRNKYNEKTIPRFSNEIPNYTPHKLLENSTKTLINQNHLHSVDAFIPLTILRKEQNP